MNFKRKFSIDYIFNEQKDPVLVSKRNRDSGVAENYYSLITGENGCGKSSLLTKAVNAFIFPNSSNGVSLSNSSQESPSRVIAICNSRYNRFPLKETFIKYNNDKEVNYYVQLDHNIEIGESVLSVVGRCLRDILANPNPIDLYPNKNLRRAFGLIGVDHNINVSLKFDEKAIACYLKYIDMYEKNIDLRHNNKHYDKSIEHEFVYYKTFLTGDNEIEHTRVSIDKLRKIILPTIKLDINNRRAELSSSKNRIPYAVESAILLGLIVPDEIKLQRTGELRWISNHQLSSGQQTLISTALIIGTFAKRNSLICIDEPENSLHPEWQLSFMGFISNLLYEDLGCHLLIATHSPQIISGLSSDNGCIITLRSHKPLSLRHQHIDIKSSENKIIFDSPDVYSAYEYRKQSSDRQLAEIFNSPGFRNDYIAHRLLMILARMLKGIRPNKYDEPFVFKIGELVINGRIKKDDPVNVVYEQIIDVKNLKRKDSGHD